MEQGFIKVAAATPKITVADCKKNQIVICDMISEMAKEHAKIMVFPELCITGYTCGDLFSQETLLTEASKALDKIVEHTREIDGIVFVGLPWELDGKLYNVVAAINHGKLLGIVPKTNIPNYGEFYELRHFTHFTGKTNFLELEDGSFLPFGTDLLFTCQELKGLVIGAEICEDVWSPNPPSTAHALAGATVMINSSASDELVGKRSFRRELIQGQSKRLSCAYIYANAGEGESTTDLVFSGHNIIAENGSVLQESEPLSSGMIYSEIDLGRLRSERRRMNTFLSIDREHFKVPFSLKIEETKLTRTFARKPFVPSDEKVRKERFEEILNIQAMGLKKRLEHTHCRSAVIGISGGLDSTLALLVTVKAFDLLNLDKSNIVGVTMPCFGTTDRTYQNACKMITCTGATFREVDIKESVMLHLKDIGHSMKDHDVTFENAQARERTQVLMDIANQTNGMVIGTGDMSELALGWATYNGDHMSMYGVNSSIPKTLVRYLVDYCAKTTKDPELRDILLDVLDTPVSPELLPPKDGKISQVTEDLVGPYELHDFFLYYILRFGYTPTKLYRIAKQTFQDVYQKETILKWLKTFYLRFFSQQFKRSCLPDGPKVGTIGISPRGDLRMPSDASSRIWLDEVEKL
ncbi:MAG TPA: NAD(+) synthase [Candidatus Merdenecus merdavium]|nr:NAD(+) synthase [Candidatus Merdenecus merdavium]